ncbi:MAG: PfkB family carbohydrate kinase, partial [Patescibacteria group bacterium]|nr:PfkB family carbohydrate kinase [Patescibacteria group bacterium]
MKVVYVGDCGVDDYNGKLYPGGCALNTAYYANQAGLKIDLVSCVGNDKNSQIPLKINSQIHQLMGKTPKQKIKVLPSGEKKFVGYYPGVLSEFNLSQKDI